MIESFMRSIVATFKARASPNGARRADRDWKAKLGPHAASDLACNFGWWTEEMSATRNIGKRLVS